MKDNFFYNWCLNLPAELRPNKWLHYFDIYDRHFNRFRNKPVVMLEIGVFKGASLPMWKAYFGEQAKIIGVDIKPECKQFEADGIEIFIGRQEDPEFIDEIFKKYPQIDIVLDDGGHRMSQQIKTFKLMCHRINPNGVYMVEDIHTSYISRYGGGLKKPDTFIEFAKNKVDELTAFYSNDIKETDITYSTDSINFYDSMVVFEKTPRSGKSLTTKGIGREQNGR